MNRKIIYAIATLSGAIIGVGFLSLPYVALKAGIWVVFGYFFALGSIVILLHLIFGKVVLETSDFLRLPGYSKIYLGKWGQRVSFFTIIAGFLGTILAYIIIGGEFLSSLFSPFFGEGVIFYTLIYFSIGVFFIYFGIKLIAKIELFGLILFFLALFFVFLKGAKLWQIDNIFSGDIWRPEFIFLPFGPIIFSLWGASLLPEIEEILNKNKKILHKVILVSLLIPLITYLAFTIFVLGVCGKYTTPEAISGLRNFLPPGAIYFAYAFGLLASFTSFIALGLTLEKVFRYDLKIPKRISWILTCFPPLILYFLGLKSFITVISLVGGVMIAIEGILIILMFKKLKRIRRFSLVFFASCLLIAIFILGIIYEVAYFLKGK